MSRPSTIEGNSLRRAWLLIDSQRFAKGRFVKKKLGLLCQLSVKNVVRSLVPVGLQDWVSMNRVKTNIYLCGQLSVFEVCRMRQENESDRS